MLAISRALAVEAPTSHVGYPRTRLASHASFMAARAPLIGYPGALVAEVPTSHVGYPRATLASHASFMVYTRAFQAKLPKLCSERRARKGRKLIRTLLRY